MWKIISPCWMVVFTASVSTHPMNSRNAVTDTVTNGSVCVTKEGVKGLCRDITVCQGFVPNDSSLFMSCIGMGYPAERTVCCPSSSINYFLENLRRLKRQAPPPPPDTPKLRVKGCGVRGSLSDFIVGGEKADFWPWMAAIFVKNNGARTKIFTCGGTVINKRYILTAAHCVGQKGKSKAANSVSVRVGSLERSSGQEFSVSSVIVHENYRDTLHYDDIALLKTSRPMEVKNVVPVCLPSPGMYNSNFFQRTASVLGWGDVSYGGVTSQSLREALVPVIPTKRCDSRYKRLSPLSLPRGITDTQLCAGAQDGSKDACQGDSGGPLLLEDRSGKWNIVGIVSFGFRCGEPDYPGVYTRVAKYLKWLQRHTDIPARPYP